MLKKFLKSIKRGNCMKKNRPDAATIARTIILLIALINQILTTLGHSPIPIHDDQVQNLVSISFTVVVSVITWWKNNSFTKSAKLGDKVMQEAKHNEVHE